MDRTAEVSLRRQCQLLGISRSSLCYQPRESGLNKELMHRIDALFSQAPYLGYRKLTAILRREGHPVNTKRIRRLMALMGLQAVYCRPNTSKPHPEYRVYPYLLKGLSITGPNQVWAADITYIRLRQRHAYLVAIMDWYSRYILAWQLSPTMEVGFCLQALEEALSQGKPCIFNSDQGSQFTSEAFTHRLEAAGITISMDGRGSYHDNIFTERLWRSVKYEEVYLREYGDFEHAASSIGAYMQRYNRWRPHQALGYQTTGAFWPCQ